MPQAPPHFLDELRAAFETRSKHAALVYRGHTIAYNELDTRARRCGGHLQELGVASGERVVIFTAEKLPFLVAQLGAMYAGAIPLPLNPRYTREEMRYFLTDSQPRVVVAGADQCRLIDELTPQLADPPAIVLDVALLESPASSLRETTVSADDACLMMYSSGTTGRPKGVVHTHANAAGSLRALQSCWRMTSDDIVINVLPLFHIHGLGFATHLTWLSGGCVWVEDAFEPRKTLEAIGRGTVFMGVPTIYYRVLEQPAFREIARSWTKARLFTCGSAPIRPDVLPQLEDTLGQPVVNRYGMTEAYVISSLPLAGPWPHGSVGTPLDGIELRVTRRTGHRQKWVKWDRWLFEDPICSASIGKTPWPRRRQSSTGGSIRGTSVRSTRPDS